MISSRDKNGAARCRRGAHAAGADKIRKAIALDPILPEQSFGLAEVRVQAGQREAAQVALRETHGVDPNDAAVSKYARCDAKDRAWIREGLRQSILSLATIEYRFRETTFLDSGEQSRAKSALAEDRQWLTSIHKRR